MAEYLSPGVYVEEVESGAVPMEGVSTSTAGFIGMAERGPVIGRPQLVTNFADYQRMYGSYLSEAKYGDYRFLPYAVEQFFLNGGSRAFIMRVVPQGAKCSATSGSAVLKFTAANPGEWGDRLRVTITPASKAKTQALEAIDDRSVRVKSCDGFTAGDVVEFYDGRTLSHNRVKSAIDGVLSFEEPIGCDIVDTNLLPKKVIKTCEFNVSVRFEDAEETYLNVSLNESASSYIAARMQKSELVTVEVGKVPAQPAAQAPAEKKDDKKDEKAPAVAPAAKAAGVMPPYKAVGGVGESLSLGFSGGSDGNIGGTKASDYMGSDNGPGKRTGIQAFLENAQVSIMAVPGVTDSDVQLALVAHCENTKSRFAVLDIPLDKKKVGDVLDHRNMFDTSYAALYHPWLEVFDPLARKSSYMPPSGAMAGIYARTDTERGVQKAPANEVVRGCTGLSCPYNEGEQDILNPQGVNLIRSFTGRGIRVWGARTASSNPLWKYINVRRLFIFVEESLKANTNWVVFEPNSEALWGRVQRTIELFLSSMWRSGALAGTSPGEAFFVNIGRSTMTQDDIDNGRLICNIGIAPVKPAEFVIFRITQHTVESAG
ncbi:phage tail sheath family protein [Anaerotruncus colihominis]|uniref:Phage tail sheath protein n=1 Tax=Anaerotruncus colihominis DSM 17241 TaxID=445972 RepID=B0P8Q5_9FIRM|nr:phage tail sheath family protein [Anaerotruncus colihominis]EDS12301.1 phage tail sheath protein [Anaerotruncus colihominis DSM 17241]UWN74410.1 phage tail sheath family protein [Anaerotruncus colihominis]